MHAIRFSLKPLDAARFHILFALAECEPASSDMIEAQITGDTMGALYIKPATFYRLLQEFAEQQLIEQANAQTNSYMRPYRLTAAGRSILQREMKRYQRVAQLGRERLSL